VVGSVSTQFVAITAATAQTVDLEAESKSMNKAGAITASIVDTLLVLSLAVL
jgi:hypothetical protein